ncbi:pyruvate kinase [Miniphocaeibacter massiliensis]|uniref:pyruvate kinase n=1 Tax=Miniphocaeibacter massiliensis TaxID=2041841 RepID=UPI000C1BBE54|nr:pyruvate kinase [Miniphocaeibacter massiliensis]
MKKTKVVCTIGPASEDKETLKEIMKLGMNVCRLNFSHGDHEEHLIRINNIKEAREELGLPIAIMLDTKGPEIRLGDFSVPQVQLAIGDKFILTTRDIEGTKEIVSVSYKDLPKDVKVGGHILVDDGLVDLKIIDITDTDVITEVQNHGILKSRKGVNIPNTTINLPAITEKDKSDLIFAIEQGLDFIAASFIRKAQDVLDIRKILEDNGGSHIQIISKIESQEGVDNLDEIIEASDGIMVARGDLGVEIKTEIMPIVQKEIIKKTSFAGKPVITATQMLDSMIRNPRPTRAEVTDVANAILDGTDAIMLSGETAAGNYPIEAVKVMSEIADSTEKSQEFIESSNYRTTWMDTSTTNAISRSTRALSVQLGATAIITATTSGSTPKAVSRIRPLVPIVATTFNKEVLRRLALTWGVYPVQSATCAGTDEVIDRSIMSAMDKGFVKEGDLIVITAGVPVGVGGTTNLIKVHTVGEILLKGQGIGKESVTGKVVKGNTPEELKDKFTEGDILVSSCTDKDIIEYVEKAGAIVVEEGGLTSHAAIVALHFKKTTLVGTEGAMMKLNDGQIITVDPISGLVYNGSARVL